jgi:hypothetical protein
MRRRGPKFQPNAKIRHEIRMINYISSLVFRLGKLHSTRGPGLFLVILLVGRVRMVDISLNQPAPLAWTASLSSATSHDLHQARDRSDCALATTLDDS